MTKLAIALGVLYIGVTYYSVTRSSEPTHPCEEGTQCLKPLVTSNDRLSLELWVLEEIKEKGEEQPEGSSKDAQKSRRQRPKHKWTAVETCQSAALTFAMSDSRTVIDETNGNCTLELSDEYRKRDGQTLRAKLVLRKVVQNQKAQQSSIRTMPVAEARFDLTRIVEKTVGGSTSSIWGFNSAAEPAEEQKAGQADSKLELNQPSTPSSFPSHAPAEANKKSNASKIIHVPHFKYLREAIVLRIVNDEQEYGMPPYRGDGILMQTYPADRSRYRPIAYVDDTALQYSSQIELAESSPNRPPLKLRIRVSIISPVRDVVNVQVRTGMKMAEGILHESELDKIRYLISDDHLYRFALTQVISFLHIWLDYLAFKDEVGFYVGRTDMGGLSVSSILSRFACSLIIFLYLLDGGGTSWLVLFSVGSGVAADLFKVWKVLKPGLSSAFPFVTIRANLSTVEKETTGYDRIARTYLGLLLYPLIAGSALYALRLRVQKLVVVRDFQLSQCGVHLWIHCSLSPIIYQLSTEIGCSHAMESIHVQAIQYLRG